MNKNESKLIPKLRFPQFINDEEWEHDIVNNLVKTVTPPKKLTSSNYQIEGEFPIIDQSKSIYCGWTNDSNALIKNALPLIIFGDHTCIIKLAKKPFAQGADGIKILKAENKIFPDYLFHYLQHNELKMEDYKRHFSILKDKIIVFPKIENGEQQKIADCLSSLDDLLSAHIDKLETLKTYKKGLMQNLFPQEDEKVPKFRFKEFEKDEDWVEQTLDEVISYFKGYAFQSQDYTSKGRRIVRVSDMGFDYIKNESNATYIDEDKAKLYGKWSLRKDDLIITTVGSKPPVYDSLVGRTIVVQSTDENSLLNQNAVCLRANIKIIQTFLNTLFKRTEYISFIESIIRGNANQGSLALVDIFKYKFHLPEKPEQQKIADTLSSLDALIKEQADKIEQLKLHKKGLMQGLFPKVKN